MATTNSLTATVVNDELARGYRVLALDVSYLDVIRFQAPLKGNHPSSPRKRCKKGLPEDQFLNFDIAIEGHEGELESLDASLAFSHPLDAPASISVPIDARVSVGSRIVFRLLTTCRAD